MASPGRCTCPAVRRENGGTPGRRAGRRAAHPGHQRQIVLSQAQTKAGEQSRLEVLVWQAEALTSEVSAEGEPGAGAIVQPEPT